MTVATEENVDLLPGYRTCERIGAGGYGEVWRAEAPGGFEKAIKVVFGYHDEDRASRELKALDRIKSVRHPFLLSVERIEIVKGRLVILTELADMSLDQRFEECRKDGEGGIPREELLGYLRDASDALDFLLAQHNLQHLDIKPENLLLVAGHIKVADFGLVKDLTTRTQQSMVGGMTPTYAAPEIFDGHPCSHSDQYSLAIVYQQMLTGMLPFPGRTPAQLAMQHTQGKPILGPLPRQDRAIVEKALAKKPGERFESCRQFVEALVAGNISGNPSKSRPAGPAAPSEKTADNNEDTKSLGSSATQCIEAGDAAEPLCTEQIIAQQPVKTEAVNNTSVVPIVPTVPPAHKSIVRVEVSTEVRSLELPHAVPQSLLFRPTLFIGAGGVAGVVLARLREQIENHPLNVLNDVLPMLFLDTDRSSIKQTQDCTWGGRLTHQEVGHLALRRPQQYRAQSPKLLQWLSRRWLYNIPRSLQTRRFRPLGRLALIDHAEATLESLREKIATICNAEQVKQLATEHSIAAEPTQPRIIIVAAPGGGTGSGIAIDLAYAVRNILEEMSVGTAEILGVFPYGTGRRREENDLSLANTYSFLRELGALEAHGNHGPHSAEGIQQIFEGIGQPFTDIYFPHLGSDLGDEQFTCYADRVADYLACDALSSVGRLLDNCRQTDRQSQETDHCDLFLRSFAVVNPATESPADDEDDDAEHSQAAWEIAPSEWGHTSRKFVALPAEAAKDGAIDAKQPGITPITANGLPKPLGIYEAAQLSLAQLADKLTECRPEIVDAAGRLHPRIDVEWPDLPQVISQPDSEDTP